MASNEVERIRQMLGNLESLQKARTSRTECHSYHLRLTQEEPVGRPGRRRVLCELCTGGGEAAGSMPEEANRDSVAVSAFVPSYALKALKSGRQNFYSLEDFDSYLATVMDEAAFSRIASKLTARERSSQEVLRMLMDEGFSADQARRAVERAQRCAIVDDARYARSFINAKLRAGWGKSRIERELSQVGLSIQDAGQESFEELAGGGEYERALEQARKKRVSEKNPVEKIARFLVGRGFSSFVALKAAKEVVAESLDSH